MIWDYQRAIHKAANMRAILCNRGYSGGELPTKLKPNVVRQDYNQYTHNWFLAEYRTLPLSRTRRKFKPRPLKGAERAKRQHQHWSAFSNNEDIDAGAISSHSIDYDCL